MSDHYKKQTKGELEENLFYAHEAGHTNRAGEIESELSIRKQKTTAMRDLNKRLEAMSVKLTAHLYSETDEQARVRLGEVGKITNVGNLVSFVYNGTPRIGRVRVAKTGPNGPFITVQMSTGGPGFKTFSRSKISGLKVYNRNGIRL